ncbi:MAG: NUDIX domain-containing protein [Candidatus Scalindua sp.]|nr:NUDIX domain-containing protein [Candidatus Scalindua sp.]
MRSKSAGIVMYRFQKEGLKVLLVHPGGPFWTKKDLGIWSIPKGEYADSEDPLTVAKREFHEETGFRSYGKFIPLTPRKQPSGKIISAWAVEGDCNASKIKSNTFSMEWPPRSGGKKDFPEVDRAGWFTADMAKKKLLKGQVGFIEELCTLLQEK